MGVKIQQQKMWDGLTGRDMRMHFDMHLLVLIFTQGGHPPGKLREMRFCLWYQPSK